MVSVIVPVYNTEKFLERCIKSIIEQKYKDFELILIDDGSTDSSGSICDKYVKSYENIQAVHNENSGPAASRAFGVSMAKGDFIMFVDSDDWLDPDMLLVMMEEQKKSEASIVTCIYTDVDDRGKTRKQETFSEDYIDCKTAEEAIWHIHKTRYLSGSPCTKLFRRELFEGIDFHIEVTIGEDYSMIVQLAERAKKIRMLSRALYYRYVRKGSISHAGYTQRHRKAFDNYMKVRMDLIARYPALEGDITAFHTEYEMAVITAMCRNDVYDTETIRRLKKDLQEHMGNTLRNEKMPLYMKCCAMMIAYAHPLFIFLFRILYHITGR